MATLGPDEPVVITGLGFISPLGDAVTEVAGRLRAGRSAAQELEGHDYGAMPAHCGGAVPATTLDRYELCPIKFKLFNRYVKFGVVAAGNALRDAGLLRGTQFDDRYPEASRAVYVSTGVNGENAEGLFEAFADATGPDGSFDAARFAKEAIGVVHPKWILGSISNNLIFFLTSDFGLRGDNNNVTYSAVGGCYMLDAAAHALRHGLCDVAVVSGSDSILNWQAQDDLAAAGLLVDGGSGPGIRAMLPFTAAAAGALPSEGSACLVLEREGAALARGARPYARVLRAAEASGGLELQPDGAPVADVLGALLGSVPAGDTVLVDLNGASQPDWDRAELRGLARAVGTRRGLTFSSSKHLFCHTHSAAFVMDAAATALALRDGFAFPLPAPPDPALAPEAAPLLRDFPCAPGTSSHRFGIVLGQCLGGATGGVLLERV